MTARRSRALVAILSALIPAGALHAGPSPSASAAAPSAAPASPAPSASASASPAPAPAASPASAASPAPAASPAASPSPGVPGADRVSDEEIQKLEKKLAENPKDSETLRKLGTAFRINGKNKEAFDLLIRSMKANQKDPRTRVQMILLLNTVGKRDAALKQLEVLKKMDAGAAKTVERMIQP